MTLPIYSPHHISLLDVLSLILPEEKTLLKSGIITNDLLISDEHVQSEIPFSCVTMSDSDSIMLQKDLSVYYALISLISKVSSAYIHIDSIWVLINSEIRKNVNKLERFECIEALQRIKKTVIEVTLIDRDKGVMWTDTIRPVEEILRGKNQLEYFVRIPDFLFEQISSDEFKWPVLTSEFKLKN